MKILIEKKNLLFREEAKRLVRKIKSKNAILDFAKVEFISRAFADEFLDLISKKSVKIKNIKPNLKKLFSIVRKQKNGKVRTNSSRNWQRR